MEKVKISHFFKKRLHVSYDVGLVCGDDGNHNDGDYDGDHLGQVGGQELEDEGEGGLGVDDVVQRHDVRVTQLLQEAGLQTIVIDRRSSKKIKTRDARNSFPSLSISF